MLHLECLPVERYRCRIEKCAPQLPVAAIARRCAKLIEIKHVSAEEKVVAQLFHLHNGALGQCRVVNHRLSHSVAGNIVVDALLLIVVP